MDEQTMLALSRLGERLAARGEYDDACAVGAVLLADAASGSWGMAGMLLREGSVLVEQALTVLPKDAAAEQIRKELRRLQLSIRVLANAALKEAKKARET